MPDPETRQRLLAEATKAFLAEGYGAASLDRIAKATQISKKTIYKHVGTKADLFMAVVENALKTIPVGELLAAADDGDPEAILRDFLTPVAALGLSEEGLRFHWMILREASRFPEIVPAFARALAGFVQGMTAWMDHQSQRGWLRIESSKDAVSTLLTMLLEDTRRHFALGQCDAPGPEEQARIVDRTVTLFLYGTVARSGLPQI